MGGGGVEGVLQRTGTQCDEGVASDLGYVSGV